MLSIYNLACCFCGKDANFNNTAAANNDDDDYNSNSTLKTNTGDVSFGHSDEEDIINSSLENSSIKGFYFLAVCLNNSL